MRKKPNMFFNVFLLLSTANLVEHIHAVENVTTTSYLTMLLGNMDVTKFRRNLARKRTFTYYTNATEEKFDLTKVRANKLLDFEEPDSKEVAFYKPNLLGRMRVFNYTNTSWTVPQTVGRGGRKGRGLFTLCRNIGLPPAYVVDPAWACKRGAWYNYSWYVPEWVYCLGSRLTYHEGICQFCHQTIEQRQHWCEIPHNCSSRSTPLRTYPSNCNVWDPWFSCFGTRSWYKNRRCNWAGTRRWYTTWVLSLTLGGLGADRFYLGMWKEGFAKMFTFGGFGIWALIDAILIGVHHMGPIDGSLFVDNYRLHWKSEGYCMLSPDNYSFNPYSHFDPIPGRPTFKP